VACGEGTEVKQASKFLALVLRHQPEVAGLTLDAQGWAPVADVLAALGRRFPGFTRGDLETVVETNDKKRYAFDESGTRIRASQGHSVAVELDLEPLAPPAILYHGTVERFLPSIMDKGLVKGSRHHVHLSADVDTALKVGGRRSGGTVILEVAAGEMAKAGHSFFQSANGVWLTDHVPPLYVSLSTRPR
jgi:putative RNA 2'-phosphotransferase